MRYMSQIRISGAFVRNVTILKPDHFVSGNTKHLLDRQLVGKSFGYGTFHLHFQHHL